MSSPAPSSQASTQRSVVLPFPWNQGEHLAVIGRTQSGKTTLLSHILRRRAYVVILRTKTDKAHYHPDRLITRADQMRLSYGHQTGIRLELKPERSKQREEFHKAMLRALEERSWAVVADEVFYLDDRLKLDGDMEELLTQGAGMDVTFIGGVQRPSRVTRFFLGEAHHILSFALERRDAKILAEASTDRMMEIVPKLGKHEFVWWDVAEPRRCWVGILNMKANRLEGMYV